MDQESEMFIFRARLMRIYTLVVVPISWCWKHVQKTWPEDGGTYADWMALNLKTTAEEFVVYASAEGCSVRKARHIADTVLNPSS